MSPGQPRPPAPGPAAARAERGDDEDRGGPGGAAPGVGAGAGGRRGRQRGCELLVGLVRQRPGQGEGPRAGRAGPGPGPGKAGPATSARRQLSLSPCRRPAAASRPQPGGRERAGPALPRAGWTAAMAAPTAPPRAAGSPPPRPKASFPESRRPAGSGPAWLGAPALTEPLSLQEELPLPFEHFLQRIARRPRPQQFFGLMGKRDAGEAASVRAPGLPLRLGLVLFPLSLWL